MAFVPCQHCQGSGEMPEPIIRQTPAEIAAVVARLTAGQRVRILEDAPGWPLHEVTGRVVEGLSGTLSLDSWPWPLRLPSGEPGPAVVGIEVLS